jgi:hypothetical protein
MTWTAALVLVAGWLGTGVVGFAWLWASRRPVPPEAPALEPPKPIEAPASAWSNAGEPIRCRVTGQLLNLHAIAA